MIYNDDNPFSLPWSRADLNSYLSPPPYATPPPESDELFQDFSCNSTLSFESDERFMSFSEETEDSTLPSIWLDDSPIDSSEPSLAETPRDQPAPIPTPQSPTPPEIDPLSPIPSSESTSPQCSMTMTKRYFRLLEECKRVTLAVQKVCQKKIQAYHNRTLDKRLKALRKEAVEVYQTIVALRSTIRASFHRLENAQYPLLKSQMLKYLSKPAARLNNLFPRLSLKV